MVTERLLGLVAGRLDLASFHLARFRVGVCMAKAGGEVLGDVSGTIAVDRRVKDLVELSRELVIGQRNKLVS